MTNKGVKKQPFIFISVIQLAAVHSTYTYKNKRKHFLNILEFSLFLFFLEQNDWQKVCCLQQIVQSSQQIGTKAEGEVYDRK